MFKSVLWKMCFAVVLTGSVSLLYAEEDMLDSLLEQPVSKVSIGGYGELHYNYKLVEGNETPSSTLDFHRFVLFLGYQFNDHWSLNSEVELEHNFVSGGQGELELEQAYVDFHPFKALGFQAGVLLPSVGILNETHEPPTFLSVERPDYASKIIPTTWFGNGVSVYGAVSGLDYRLVILEGLDGSAISSSSAIRSARGKGFKGFEENAKYLLYNLSLNYSGISGLKIGGSQSYNNAFVTNNGAGDINIPVYISEIHVQLNKKGFISTFEAAYIHYANQSVNDLQASFGYYLELGYDLARLFKGKFSLIPFARWSHVNTAWKTWSGSDPEQKSLKWMCGVAVKPIDQVSIKFDYSHESKGESSITSTTAFNAGVGYQF